MENNATLEARKILFSPPDISDKEVEEVVAALKSGWITTGPRTKLLEKKIAEWIGVEKAVCLNSQTACAEMALRLLGIGEGDEVITCAYTYTASASIIDHVGAKIVLVDCQKDSNLIDYDALEKSITTKTKAIIPVDLCGVPCNYDRLFKIVESKKDLFQAKNDLQKAIGRIAICADTAHAFGSSYHGRMVGSIADFSAFSFHAVKNFTTAEGGALTWKDIPGVSNEEIYKRLQLLSLHGQNKDALSKSKLGSWEYDIIGPWFKCNMTDLLAAVGLAQFDRYPDLLKKRRATNEKYDSAFKPLGIQVVPHYSEEYTSTGHLYLIRIPGIDDAERREIIERLGEQGIACNVHYKPLPMMTAYKNMGFDMKDYPNAYNYYHNLITLPNHTLMSEEDEDYVIYWVKKIVSEYLK
ncbi:MULTISPECIES: DegT/DnrJ/EryC1/StrS aminotransferase family protein [Terrabacteria group]|uniref:DegT/DnrJ/EryC1/StrS family aminotransferase n=1 Tax=Bacillati TaxID=1783272 RepID=UPI0019397D23|nr:MULTISPECIES: DegT/DnrJ/EryC1/StrS family aminotransferase [Terrabacteria group]MBW9211946.1 DegT/DnrJ/EryC1/StrS family aminotransferase [Trueperella sp. zg.1013]QRG87254.1 DegT/DnrJ/EryC1/StrS family aminotransferase [Bulleidia sp. zg-1006]